MLFEIPRSLEKELENMGILSTEHEEIDDPRRDRIRELKFRKPNLDENGEPDF